jgi:hypothetical protein
MGKNALPARLLELAERWVSPFAHAELLNVHAELVRFREQTVEARACRHQWRESPELAELNVPVIEHAESFAADAERRLNTLIEEVEELGTLVHRHAPDLACHLPRSIDFTGKLVPVEARVRQMEMLYGLLRGKSQPEPVMLGVQEWAHVWGCARNKAGETLLALQAKGLARKLSQANVSFGMS